MSERVETLLKTIRSTKLVVREELTEILEIQTERVKENEIAIEQLKTEVNKLYESINNDGSPC